MMSIDLDTLDVDLLRARCTMIHYFGLGFIQVKLNDKERLHFYHDHVPAYVDEPHNHRYDFTSTVVRGALGNTIWSKSGEGDAHQLFDVFDESCAPDHVVTDPKPGVKMHVSAMFVTRRGSSYSLHRDVFHVVEPLLDEGPCITHLHRGQTVKEHAQVLRRPGAEKICPFSRQMTDDELWRIVRLCLAR